MHRFRLALAAAVIGGLGVLADASSAHHSFGMYDQAHPIILRGAIKSFKWTNPHVIVLAVAAPSSGGAPETWSLELTSPGNLTRIGWSRHSLNPGDKVELEVSPLRDGQHGGALNKVTLVASGQVLSANWLKPGG